MPKVLAFRREHRYITADGEAAPLLRERAAPGSEGRTAVLRQSDDGTATERERLLVSIVVPTRGRPELLNRCLASLVLQSFDSESFEIIIVDDDPGFETESVVTRWSDHTLGTGPQITYIPSPGPHGPAAARNHGWRVARAEIVAFTDDDTIARADWLRNGLQAFDDDEVAAVRGRIVMPLDDIPTDYEMDAKNLETAEFVTANCFCRRRILEEIGGFDERFRFAWREDSDLHFALLTRNDHIAYEPTAVMTHPIRPAHWGVSLSQVKKVQYDALLYKKHPQLYRQRIRAQPRYDFYITVGALLACIVSLLADTMPSALVSGLAWLCMTGRFCLQRLRRTSKAPSHVAEMILTSVLIPPLAVFWRAVGAFKFKVSFL